MADECGVGALDFKNYMESDHTPNLCNVSSVGGIFTILVAALHRAHIAASVGYFSVPLCVLLVNAGLL